MDVYSTSQVSSILKMTRQSVYNRVAKGDIRADVSDSPLMFSSAEVLKFKLRDEDAVLRFSDARLVMNAYHALSAGEDFDFSQLRTMRRSVTFDPLASCPFDEALRMMEDDDPRWRRHMQEALFIIITAYLKVMPWTL